MTLPTYQLTDVEVDKWIGWDSKNPLQKSIIIKCPAWTQHSDSTEAISITNLCFPLFLSFFFLFHLSVTRCLLVLLEWNLVPLITRRFQIWSSLLLSTPRWEGVIAIMQLRICNPRWSCNLKMKRRAWSCYGYDMKVLHDYLWSEFLLLRFQKKTFKENVSFGRRMAGKLI